MAAFAQDMGLAQIDSIHDQIIPPIPPSDPAFIDHFLLNQANAERDNPVIQVENEEDEERELTEEEKREADILDDYLSGMYFLRYDRTSLDEGNNQAIYDYSSHQRRIDLNRWRLMIEKGNYSTVVYETDDYYVGRHDGNWTCHNLLHRYDPDLLEREKLKKEANDLWIAQRAFQDAIQEEQRKRKNAFKTYVLKTHPLDQPIQITFTFTGFKDKKQKEKTVSVDVQDFADRWYRIPFIDALFGMIYDIDETDRESLQISFFPLTIPIDKPVIPKAIDDFVRYIATKRYYITKDLHINTSAAAESLGIYDLSESIFRARDPNTFTMEEMQFMSGSMKESLIRWYLGKSFKINAGPTVFYQQPKGQVGLTLIKISKKELDATKNGFRRRLMDFVVKKPDLAEYIFNNHKSVFRSYIIPPDRQQAKFKKISSFQDLLTFIDFLNDVSDKRQCGGSEVMKLARQDPKIKALYAKLARYENRDRRGDHYFQEDMLNPQEVQDSLYREIALAERDFMKRYNQKKTIENTPKDQTLAAKAACSSTTPGRRKK